MIYDIVIAGSGPAGIACALSAASQNPNMSILLLEAGRSHRRRPCPVDKGFRCTGCAGICNVVSGFGGCMHYGDGVKLSLLPSGRRLVDLFGPTEADLLCEQAYAMLTQDIDEVPPLQGTGVSGGAISAFAARGLSIREYPVAVLSESDLRHVLDGAYRRVMAAADHWEQAELVAADPCSEGFVIKVRTLQGVREVTTHNLVVATGRRGVTKSAALFDHLQVERVPPNISTGVRFEMRADLLAEIGTEHPDLKISQLEGRINKTKTFCFCGGPNGGRIKLTNYQDSFGGELITLDGHETTERMAGDRPLAANFGLLVQTRRDSAVSARENLVSEYRSLSGGRPVVQSLRAFAERRSDDLAWSELNAQMSFEPSVVDLIGARVDSLFSDAEHDDLISGFERVMASILDHGRTGQTVDRLADDVLVIGPEVEFMWDRVVVDADCRVPDLPLYVVGDTAGIAQGVVQAAMTGIAAARAIVSAPATRRSTSTARISA